MNSFIIRILLSVAALAAVIFFHSTYSTYPTSWGDNIQTYDEDVVLQVASKTTSYFSNTKSRRLEEKESVVDFVIGAFPKCGTSFLLHTLLNTEYINLGSPPGEKAAEIYDLQHNDRISKFIRRYDISTQSDYVESDNEYNYSYHRIYNGQKVVNGFKQPTFIESQSGMHNLLNLSPNVDLIITTRHPVLWFQSFYNFRTRGWGESGKGTMPDPLKLIGSNCSKGVCTDSSNYHHYLARLLFTPLDEEERRLLGKSFGHHFYQVKGKMFIMELGQLADDSTNRKEQFTSDLEEFLHLKPQSLPNLAHMESKKSRNSTHYLAKMAGEEKKRPQPKLDICKGKYRPLRDRLVKNGIRASRWIERYLIQSPRVVISSKDFFLELINLWQFDPCDDDDEAVIEARRRGLLSLEDYKEENEMFEEYNSLY